MLILNLLLVYATVAQDTQGVFVANQGNFTDNNGSVSFHEPATGQTSSVLENFGTIVQSVEVFNERAYVVSNTGGRIEILDAATGQQTAQISGLANPRYLAFASETKAYLTNQVFRFGGVTDKSYVSIIDLESNVVTDTLQVPGQPDHIVVVGNRAFVALGYFGDTSLVGIIDTDTDQLIQTVDVECAAPRYLVVDIEKEVYVMCNGIYDFVGGVMTDPGAIVTLDGESGAILNKVELTGLIGPSPTNLGAGQDATYGRQTAFIIAGEEILLFDTENDEIEGTIDAAGDDLIGGLAYDEASDLLYVARWDAVNAFTTAGRVETYPLGQSEPSNMFDVAIAPVHIAFHQPVSTAIDRRGDEVPSGFGLLPNYPNPFNPTTTLPFEITQAGHVTLTIYDALGREVDTLVDAPMATGVYEARWDASTLSSGIYISRLVVNGQSATRRLVLMK